MPNTDIDSLKHDIDMIRAWVAHWAEDAKARLPITNESIGHALMVIDRARVSLARIEAAEQREIAA